MKFLKRDAKKKWLKSLPARASSSTLILENSAEQVLIVKANYKPYWTFPGGLIDAGETPKQAAIRETFEEVGIVVDPTKVEFVAVVNRKSDYADTYQFIFKAPLTKAMVASIVLQESEIDAYALVTKAHIRSGDKNYGRVIEHWAQDHTGYIEQTFGANEQ
ncbi:MAG TPA: NUDIX hydrolase [Candidatus Saccharimonadales bacterium]